MEEWIPRGALERYIKMIEKFAYAKINLALEVSDKREDGYHGVRTIMVPIDLYDQLTFSSSKEIVYRSNYEIEDDIVIKALSLFYKKYNIKDGVCITLDKGIPVEAGLAGGSADAAATLNGLNEFFNIGASKKELEVLANSLGSDVSYCLYNEASVCTGRGEVVSRIDSNYTKVPVILINPGYGLSTKMVYDNYKSDNTLKDLKINNIIKGLKDDDLKMVSDNIFNDLESVSIELVPPLKNLYDDIKALGLHPYLSGSGPTLYLFNEDGDLSSLKKKYEGLGILKTYLK